MVEWIYVQNAVHCSAKKIASTTAERIGHHRFHRASEACVEEEVMFPCGLTCNSPLDNGMRWPRAPTALSASAESRSRAWNIPERQFRLVVGKSGLSFPSCQASHPVSVRWHARKCISR